MSLSVEVLESVVDSPAMEEALAVVYDRSDGGDEELQWRDVKDSLSTEQWGRLIERGVLAEGESGFTITDPEAVDAALTEESDTALDLPDIEPVSWTWYDKAAALGALVFFVGYSNAGVRNTVASLDNVLLGPLTDLLPFYDVILVLAVVTGLFSTVVQSRLMDNEKMKQYQERMQFIQDRREAAKERGDDEALQRIQEEQVEAMSDQLGMFKVQFRPMVWTMLLTIPVFLWLRWMIRGGHLGVAERDLILPLVGHAALQDPLLGLMPVWIVWYFLSSMAARQLIQKTLDIQTSPSSS